MEEGDPEEGFSEGGEKIIGEEDPKEGPEEDPEENPEEDPEDDPDDDPEEYPTEEGLELTHEVYFEEEPRAESRVLKKKGMSIKIW